MMPGWRRRAETHSRGADVTLALLLLAVAVPGSMFSALDGSARPDWWMAVPLSAVGCAALLWHRRHPRAVVAVTAACAMILSLMGFLLTPLLQGPMMAALYWLAVDTDRKTSRVHTIATGALLVITVLSAGPVDRLLVVKAVNPLAWILLSAVFGSAVRLRRDYLRAVEARAEFAERTREEEARHRVAEERLRIARELHDVVAHHLALANAQASTAAHLAPTHPEQIQEILDDLARTTSSALRELKATVGVLRRPNDTDTLLEPSPGLARLDDFAASFASAGLTVTVTTEGEPRPLSPGVDLTAFRIVQEALTNVTKHAGAKTAHVRLAYSSARLTITVTDDGRVAATRPAGAPSRGFGIIGMRERAHSVGGHLEVGLRPRDGFRVTARLPLYAQNPEEERTP